MALSVLDPAVRVTKVTVTTPAGDGSYTETWEVETPDGFGVKRRTVNVTQNIADAAEPGWNSLVADAEEALGL